jgi:methanogenic corrinoid protein MtbC1
LSEAEQRLKQLTNALLAGKAEDARHSTNAALAQGSTVNEILDALVDAVNIIVDLNDVDEYDQAKMTAAEEAVMVCLQTIEERLQASEGRFHAKASTGPVGIKAGNLLSIAISASLRSVGFQATCLGKTKTALDLLRNSEELGVDLVIPLLAEEGVEEQLRSFTESFERGGFKSKFAVIPVAPGLPESVHATIPVARNMSEAISKATEWALKRQNKTGAT